MSMARRKLVPSGRKRAEILTMAEQRRLQRRKLIYYLKITDQANGQELGRLGDIHQEGMLVMSPQPLPLEQIYQLALELPKSLVQEGCPSTVLLSAQSLWRKPGPKGSGFHEHGLRFLDVSERQAELIQRLIDLFAMPG